MHTQKLHKRELLAHALKTGVLGVFAVLSILLYFGIHTPVKTAAAGDSTINFQARLQTSAGAIAPDGNYNVEFKLYNVSSGGTALWTEDYTYNGGSPDHRVRVANGYLSANLGSVTPFSGINWDQSLYLTMNIGGASTTATWDGEMNPRLKVTSVPYAFQAASASQLQQLQGSYTGTLGFGTLTYNRSINLPDENGTVCLQASANCGFLNSTTADTNYIRNTDVQHAGNINIISSDPAKVGLVVQGNSTQSTDLLQVIDSSGTPRVKITNTGTLSFGSGSFWSSAGRIFLQSSDTTNPVLQIKAPSGIATDILTITNSVGTVSKFDANGQLTLGRVVTSGTGVAGTASFADGTTDGFTSTLKTSTVTANRNILLPNEDGTICLQSSVNCGFLSSSTGVSLQTTTPGSAQTGNFNISGTGIAGTLNATTALQTGGTTRIDGSGNLSNIGTIAGSGTLQLSGTSGTSYVMSTLGLGTTSPQAGSALTVGNSKWISAVDSAGTGYVNMFQVNSNNEIQVGAALNIDGGILLPNDGGQMTFADMGISASTATGTPESYTFGIGNANVLTVYGESNGAGSSQNQRVAIGSAISPQYTLDVGGDINTSTGFRVGGTAGSTTTCSSGNVLQNAVVQGGIVTGGTCVANGGGVAPTLQNVYDNSSSTPNIILSSTGHGLVVKDASTTVGGNLFAIQNNGGTTSYLAVTTSGASVAGSFSATGAISGVGINSGSGLIQGTGGLTLTGTTAINTSGSSNITLGNSSGGTTTVNGTFTVGTPTNGHNINIGGLLTSNCGVGGLCSTRLTSISGGQYIDLDNGNQGIISLVGPSQLQGVSNIYASAAGSTILNVIQQAANATAPVAIFKNGATPGSNADIIQGQNSSSGVLFQVKKDGTVNSVAGYQFNGTSGATTTCSSGNVLQNAVVQGGIITGGTCVAAGAGGVTTIGTIDGGTYSANGASISGSTIYLQAASATQVGLMTTGTQAFAGDKSFSGSVAIGLSSPGATLDIGAVSDTSVALRVGTHGGGAADAFQVFGNTYEAFRIDSSSITHTLNGLVATTTSGGPVASFQGNVQMSGTGSNQLAITGAPAASATSSLIQIGNAIAGGNSSANGGTYLGMNAPSTGAGSAADFLNFQHNGTTKLSVDKDGYLFTATGLTVGGSTTISAFDVTASTISSAGGGFSFNGTAGSTVSCTGGNVLQNAVVQGGIITGGSCAANGGGVAPTLQDAYNNSSDGVIAESGTKGLTVKDASSTVGNIIQVQNYNGTATYFTVTANGAQAAAFDAQAAGNLAIGTSTATSITVGSGSTTTTFSGNVTLASGKTFGLAGAETITATNAAALKIQDGSNNVLLTADTSAMQVIVGSSTNGITLSANGISLSGTAQKTKAITLMPEFGGAVLDPGSGVNNTGTMTSGYDSISRMNFYKWTTTQGSNQSYDVVVQVPIPSDFSSWGSTALAITAYTSNTTNGTITAQVTKSNGSSDTHFASLQSATPGSTGTWTTTNFSLDSSNYTAGDYLTIRIRLQSPNGGDVRLGKIVLNYKNAY